MDILEVIEQNNVKRLKTTLTEDRYFKVNDTIKDRQGSYVTTPLIKACQCGNQAIVKLLFQHHAEVNKPSQDASGQTPLYVACEAGDKALVELLIGKECFIHYRVKSV